MVLEWLVPYLKNPPPVAVLSNKNLNLILQH
jgi:hypothetical protein